MNSKDEDYESQEESEIPQKESPSCVALYNQSPPINDGESEQQEESTQLPTNGIGRKVLSILSQQAHQALSFYKQEHYG